MAYPLIVKERNTNGVETMKAVDQIKFATDFGRATFHANDKCTPAFDARLMAMLRGREIGSTPEGEASSTDIMDAWSAAWHRENLAAAI